MPNVEDVVRKCPSCGRRLKVKLIGKKLTEKEKATFEQTQLRAIQGMSGFGSRLGGMVYGMTPMQEKVPVTVTVEWWKYTYRCGRCGHEWTEDRREHGEGSQGLKTGSLS